MKISASIFATENNYYDYAKYLKKNNVDYLHIDLFQNSLKFSLDDILEFDESYLPLDVHLIYDEITEHDIEILNKANIKYLNIQYENLKNKNDIKKLVEKTSINIGISVTIKTPLSVIDEYIDYISQVLFMCSEPGISGAKFNSKNYRRIQTLHEKYPNLFLAVDGGIDNQVVKRMEKLGVSLVVSGSYLSKQEENMDLFLKNIYELRFLGEYNINVTRNMLKIKELPIVDLDMEFFDVLSQMNYYRLGIVFVLSGDKLEGIITDGDIRRAFLVYRQNTFFKKAQELMNKEPFTVSEKENMENLYKRIAKAHRGIDVVPVCDDKNKLLGAVDLHIGK